MYPYSHAWSPSQKLLLVISGAVLIAALSTSFYALAQRYGPPPEDVLVGTWYVPEGMVWDTSRSYYEFSADRTLTRFTIFEDGFEIRRLVGRWHAAGRLIYVMRPRGDEPRLIIWGIADVSDTELRLYSGYSQPEIWTRATTVRASTSNQTMERTADRGARHL